MDQTMEAAYSFGLDLGTHRSLMAVKTKGGTVEAIIPSNQECRKGIPSLFWRTSESDGGRELLCEQVALEQGEVNDPEGVVRSVKTRLLEQKPIVLHGRSYTPQDIAAKEVGHVYALSLSEAEERGIFETPKALTVGVPVRFGAAERTAIRSVLSKALPDMPIQLLPEPMAAAIYYAASARQKTRYTLAFDMGAGTFDVCVLESVENDPREPYPFRQLSHDGSREAGDLLDEKMEELILDKLRRDPGSIDMKSFSPGSYDLRALRKTAREAKEALSSAPQFTAIVTSLASRGIQRVTLHREEYEARIEPVVRRAVDLAEKALREAKIWQSPDLTVLMVGGSSYIPLVQRLLRERFPWLDPKTQVVQRLPDQAVALGCALFAERPLADRKVRFAYAIKAYRGNSDEQFLYVCIPMNCTLPCSVSGRFSTRLQEQDNVALKIFEVDHGAPLERIPVKEGRFTQLVARHSFGKPVPKGTSVLVTTELSKDGLLTLTVDDGGISTQGITRHTFDIVRSLDD